MKAVPTPARFCTIAFALLAAFGAPVFAGVNRWTSGGPVPGVNHVAIDPVDPTVVYAATREGVFKSTMAV